MTHPALSPRLREHLARIEPSRYESLEYRPCRVTLTNGDERDFVVFARAADYITYWGVWPTEDSGKRSLDVETVMAVHESLNRLPAPLATKLYDLGETGNGYYVYTVVLRDGRRCPCTTGGLVDFPMLPSAVTSLDIADVEPGVGAVSPPETTRDYAWCLYED